MNDLIAGVLIAALVSYPVMAGELKLTSKGSISEGQEANSESIDRSVNACVHAARNLEPSSSFSAKWDDKHVVYDGTRGEESVFLLCMHGMGYGPDVRAGEDYQDER